MFANGVGLKLGQLLVDQSSVSVLLPCAYINVAPPIPTRALLYRSLMKKKSHRFAYRQSDGGIFSMEASASQEPLAYVASWQKEASKQASRQKQKLD